MVFKWKDITNISKIFDEPTNNIDMSVGGNENYC